MAEPVRCPQTGRRILGKRPVQIRWTPSKPLPWWFGYWGEGHRFTAQQEEALIALGRDPVTAEALDVRREINVHDPGESGMPVFGELLPIYQFACPVIGKGKGDLVRVIGPNGKPHDVHPDGWAHRARRTLYHGNGF